MFFGLSSTICKFAGFRLGLGIRITKDNFAYMLIVMCLIWMIQLSWYLIVFCCWLTYAYIYGIVWCIIKLVKFIKSRIARLNNPN